MPSEAVTTSCGCESLRRRSYSVMITRVALPLGRGSVFSGYSHRDTLLKLMVLKNSPHLRNRSGFVVSIPGGQFTRCGCNGELVGQLPGALRSMRSFRTWVHAVASCFERTIRSTV